MSSIIDALKKSDANRPRTNHGLKMQVNLGNESPKKNRYWFLALLLFAVAAVAVSWSLKKPALIWQQEDTLFTDSSVDSKPNEPNANQSKTRKQSIAMQAKSPNSKLAKPEPKKVKTKAQQPTKNQNPRFADQETEAPAITEATEPSKLPNETTTAESKPTSTQSKDSDGKIVSNDKTDATVDTDVDQERQAIDEQLSATPMRNKQATKQSEAPVQTQIDKSAALPQIFELPFAVRKELPKLNLSVHVYDPVVENRMVILNGVSVHVGDTIEDQVTVKDIIQTGVVLTAAERDFIILK